MDKGYPKKVMIGTFSDGSPIYEKVNSEEELEQLYVTMEEEKERVRNYFAQYKP